MWFMGMTEYHDVGILRVDPQMLDIVQRKKSQTAEVEGRCLGQFPRPILCVDIPAHRGYRSNSLQISKDSGITNISGVNDEIRSLKRINRLRTQQTVCVGDHANSDDLVLHLAPSN